MSGSAASGEIEVRGVDEVDPRDVVEAINSAFGKRHELAWYRWKHQNGPWGASIGRVALDERGIVGVRLLLPWALDVDGEVRVVHRAVEAATVPRAQGRGVFARLNAELMESLGSRPGGGAIFSTPNERSRGGHQRLGWRLLPPIAHGYRPAPVTDRGRAAIQDLEPGWDLPETRVHDGRVRTAWDTRSLRWRLDLRSGSEYRTVALAQEDSPVIVVYRIARSRTPRVVVLLSAWGAARPREALVAAIARRERAPLILQAVGEGAAQSLRHVGITRGGSVLTVWRSEESVIGDWPVERRDGWALSMADLESVL